MNDPRDDDSSQPDGVTVAAGITLAICVIVLIGAIVGVVNTPVGPEGDPDATDGQWKAMFGCFPVLVLTIVSAVVFAFALRRRKLPVRCRGSVAAGQAPVVLALVVAHHDAEVP